jgi:hypothetical protein
VSRVLAATYVHCIFFLLAAGVAFRRKSSLRPVVLLHITSAKFGDMVGEPNPKHLWVVTHRILETVPPY